MNENKMKAYIILEMEEIDGDIHVTSKGEGNPEDLILLLAYLYNDRPDYFLAAMQDEVQESIGNFKTETIN